MDINDRLSLQEFKSTVRLLNKNVLHRIHQRRSPSNPCNGAVKVAPCEAAFDDCVCRRKLIFNNFAHENRKFPETGLCCGSFEGSFHREKVEEIPSFAVWHDGTVDEDDSRKRIDFHGRVEFVHESRSGDFVVNVDVEASEETDKFVADSGANGTVPVGNQDAIEGSRFAIR